MGGRTGRGTIERPAGAAGARLEGGAASRSGPGAGKRAGRQGPRGGAEGSPAVAAACRGAPRSSMHAEPSPRPGPALPPPSGPPAPPPPARAREARRGVLSLGASALGASACGRRPSACPWPLLRGSGRPPARGKRGRTTPPLPPGRVHACASPLATPAVLRLPAPAPHRRFLPLGLERRAASCTLVPWAGGARRRTRPSRKAQGADTRSRPRPPHLTRPPSPAPPVGRTTPKDAR